MTASSIPVLHECRHAGAGSSARRPEFDDPAFPSRREVPSSPRDARRRGMALLATA